MTPKTYKALAIFFFLSAAIIAFLNLKRTMHLGWKTIPFAFIALGIIMLNRAKKVRASQL